MQSFDLTYSAFLFPAIPLMMLTFGNRWISISTLIRKMHAEFIDKKKSSNEKSAKKYLSQIKVLNKRLRYVKLMQFFSGLSFLCNLITIMAGTFNLYVGLLFFSKRSNILQECFLVLSQCKKNFIEHQKQPSPKSVGLHIGFCCNSAMIDPQLK